MHTTRPTTISLKCKKIQTYFNFLYTSGKRLLARANIDSDKKKRNFFVSPVDSPLPDLALASIFLTEETDKSSWVTNALISMELMVFAVFLVHLLTDLLRLFQDIKNDPQPLLDAS